MEWGEKGRGRVEVHARGGQRPSPFQTEGRLASHTFRPPQPRARPDNPGGNDEEGQRLRAWRHRHKDMGIVQGAAS